MRAILPILAGLTTLTVGCVDAPDSFALSEDEVDVELLAADAELDAGMDDDAPGGFYKLGVRFSADTMEEVDLYTLDEELTLKQEDMRKGDTAFLILKKGTRTLTLDINNDGDGDFFFELPPVGDRHMLKVIIDSDDENNTFVVLQTPEGIWRHIPADDIAYVRVGNITPDSGPVDVYLNDRRIGENVYYGDFNPYVSTPVGTHSLTVVSAGDDRSDPLMDVEIQSEADSEYSLVSHGYVDDMDLIAVFRSTDDLAEGMVRVRVAHTDPLSEETVHFWLTESESVAGEVMIDEDVEYGYASETDHTPGVYNLAVDSDYDGIADTWFMDVDIGTIEQTNIYFHTDELSAPALTVQLQSSDIMTYEAY